jgi:RND family efflux transporter MFP subunit
MTIRNQYLAISGLLLSTLLLQGCEKNSEIRERNPLTVSTVSIEEPIVNHQRNFKGTVVPADLTPLSFRVEGELEAILVRKGQKVEKGQLLARLDSSKLRQQLADAQAQYELASKQENRGRDLVGRNMISQSEFDELQATKRIAEVNYTIAKHNLDYTQLIAPFDGYISEVPKKSYENVTLGEVILSLYRGDVVRVDLALSDATLATLNPNENTRQYQVETRFFGSDEVYYTRYVQHNSEPEQGSNSFRLSMEMTQVTPPILPGTSANLYVDMVGIGLQTIEGYQIPMTALDAGHQANEFYVWKVSGDTVHKVPVEIAKINSGGAVVSKGVKSGDVLVNTNLRRLRNDAVVVLMEGEE